MSASMEVMPPNGHETMLEAVFNKIKSKMPNDENVKQSPNDSTDAEYRILFSNTADDTERTEKVQKNSDFSFNPSKATLKIGRAFSSGGVMGTRDTSIGIPGIDISEYVGSTLQNQLSLRKNDITLSSTWDGTHTSLKDALTSYSGGYTAGAGINISNNIIRTYGIGEYNNNQRPSFRFYSSNTSGEYTAAGLSDSDNLAIFAVALSDAPLTNHGALLSIKSVGTPCQFFFPDNQKYVYKRWYTSGAWTSWEKLNAGVADAVAWDNITGKPSTFPPSSHSHSYLPLSGGTLTGALTLANATKNTIGDDVAIGDINRPGGLAIQGVNGDTNLYFVKRGNAWSNNATGNYAMTWNGSLMTFSGHTQVGGVLRVNAISRTDTSDNGYVNHVNPDNNAYRPIRASAFTTMSCKHTKTNVVDISEEDALKLLGIRPVNFDYKEEVGGQKDQIGVLAEDTYEILPKVVSVPDNYVEEDFDISKGIHQPLPSVDYAKFVPYLIKLVQLQQKEIDILKSKLN